MRRTAALRYLLLVLVAGALGLGVAFAPVLTRLDYGELPTRASWQLPERVVDVLELRPGDHVADVGAGNGYFTFRLAEAVGAEGRVYAVDVDERIIDRLRQEVESRDFENVEVVLAAPDDPGLPDGAIDLAFLVNVYHHIEDRVAYFGALRRDLKPSGRVAVVDMRARAPFRWLSPPGHETSLELLLREMESAGYRLVESYDFLPVQNLAVFSPIS